MNFKKLSIATLLVLPFMAACSGGKTYTETRTEEEIVEELGAAAMSEVGVALSKFASAGVALGETELIMSVNEKVWEGDEFGLNFSFTYSLSAQEEYETEYLSLGQDNDSLVAQLVIGRDLANYDIASALNAAAYTLTAKLSFKGYAEGFVAPKGLTITDTYVGKQLSTKSFNALVKAATEGSLSEIRKAAKGDMVFTTGIVTAAYDWNYSEIFRGVIIADGSDGALLYGGNLQAAFYDDEQSDPKIEVGDVVEVYGEVSPYNGLFEIKPQVIRKVTSADAIAEAGLEEPTFRTVTAKEIADSKQENTGDLVRIEGLSLASDVDLSKLSVGSHWTINAKDSEGNNVQIYVNYHIGDAAQNQIKTLLSSLTGTFNFKGVLSAYNAMQLTPMAIGDDGAGACFYQ